MSFGGDRYASKHLIRTIPFVGRHTYGWYSQGFATPVLCELCLAEARRSRLIQHHQTRCGTHVHTITIV